MKKRPTGPSLVNTFPIGPITLSILEMTGSITVMILSKIMPSCTVTLSHRSEIVVATPSKSSRIAMTPGTMTAATAAKAAATIARGAASALSVAASPPPAAAAPAPPAAAAPAPAAPPRTRPPMRPSIPAPPAATRPRPTPVVACNAALTTMTLPIMMTLLRCLSSSVPALPSHSTTFSPHSSAWVVQASMRLRTFSSKPATTGITLALTTMAMRSQALLMRITASS